MTMIDFLRRLLMVLAMMDTRPVCVPVRVRIDTPNR